MADIKTMVDEKIKGKKVMVFSKNGCPFCTKAKNVFNKMNLSPGDIEIWDMERDPKLGEIQDYLATLTGGRTVPRVFINGTCIGGGSETENAFKNGSLQKMIG